MEKTLIVADSCCDIPARLAKELNIRVLPVHIVYPEGDYLDDGIHLDPRVVYQRFPEEIPHTSMPSPLEIQDFLQQIVDDGYDHMIAVCISDHLSGTVNLLTAGTRDFPQLTSFVYNTKNISMGSGIYAVWAARKQMEGMSYEEICRGLEAKRPDSHLMFYMDTLDYLKKGGRIGNVAAFVASALRLKPIIACDDDGIYYTVAKIRGSRKAKNHLLREVTSAAGNSPCWAAIMNGGDEEGGREMFRLVREHLPQAEIIVENHQIAASLAVHTGPGLVGLLVFNNP